MTPLQLFLLYAWGALGFAFLLGAPRETLAAAAFVGATVSTAGLVAELLEL